jgi:hypothetical protein
MRRFPSLILIATLLAVLGGTFVAAVGRGEAAEGDPGDYCSQAPDHPLGWLFTDACQGHDECIDALGVDVTVPDRLGCDDRFLGDLLAAHHVRAEGSCNQQLVCRALALTYHRIVRFVTVQLAPPGGRR